MITACTQNHFEILESCSIEHARLTIVRFITSDKPFCSGMYGAVFSCMIPWFLRKPSNLKDMYSPPLSVCKTLIVQFAWFSAVALKSLKAARESFLCCIGTAVKLGVRTEMSGPKSCEALASTCRLRRSLAGCLKFRRSGRSRRVRSRAKKELKKTRAS